MRIATLIHTLMCIVYNVLQHHLHRNRRGDSATAILSSSLPHAYDDNDADDGSYGDVADGGHG